MTFLKTDPTDRVKECICDSLCVHAQNSELSQDELDDKCETCIVDRIEKIEISGGSL